MNEVREVRCPLCGAGAITVAGAGSCPTGCHSAWIEARHVTQNSLRILTAAVRTWGPLEPPSIEHIQAVRRN